jgi:hypothetical protein
VALARTGRYSEAAQAWRRAEMVDPAVGDHSRYMMRVANLAAELGQLPAASPTGTPWSSMGRDELEQVMREQASVVAEVKKVAEEEKPLSPERHAELQARVDAAKPLFVASALQFGIAGYGLREVSFFGGWAPLIFRTREWTVPHKKWEPRQKPPGPAVPTEPSGG